MTQDEIFAERLRVVRVARTWIGTPFHANGRLRGVGSDCLTTLAGIAEDAGLTPHIEIPHWIMGQNLHRDAETYINGLLQYCNEVAAPPERTPQPADIVLWRFGRIYFHGAIVVAWPRIIHVYGTYGVVQPDNVEQCQYLKFIGENGPERGKVRPMKVFVFKAWGP
jgi:cell wall-associated NlpC family hydrolase